MKLLVKLGGTLLDGAESRDCLARQIAATRAAGHEVTVVHGGREADDPLSGRPGNREPLRRRPASHRTGDRRRRVLKVFAGTVNHELVASLNRAGALGVGLSGIDSFLAEAEQMDPALGAVGRVTRSNAALLNLLTANGYVPVVACVAGDRQGNIYNVNADQMAVGLRGRVRGGATDLPDGCGWRPGRREGGLRPVLTAADSRQLIADGVATGGMQAKLNAALSALEGGVEQVRIAPGAAPSVLEKNSRR